MFKIFNETYYVDIDKIDEYVQFTEEAVEETDTENEEVTKEVTKEEKQIHLVRYELVKNFLETVLTESNEVDEDLGMKTNEVSIPFKIAFNSLLVKKIINKL
jgi:hypothetical protein